MKEKVHKTKQRTVRKELHRDRRLPHQNQNARQYERQTHVHEHRPPSARVVRPRRTHQRRHDRKGRLAARIVVNLLHAEPADGLEVLPHEVVRPEALRLARDREEQRARVPTPPPEDAPRERP